MYEWLKKLKHAEVDRGGTETYTKSKTGKQFLNALCTDLTFIQQQKVCVSDCLEPLHSNGGSDVVLKRCSNTQTLHNLLIKP